MCGEAHQAISRCNQQVTVAISGPVCRAGDNTTGELLKKDTGGQLRSAIGAIVDKKEQLSASGTDQQVLVQVTIKVNDRRRRLANHRQSGATNQGEVPTGIEPGNVPFANIQTKPDITVKGTYQQVHETIIIPIGHCRCRTGWENQPEISSQVKAIPIAGIKTQHPGRVTGQKINQTIIVEINQSGEGVPLNSGNQAACHEGCGGKVTRLHCRHHLRGNRILPLHFQSSHGHVRFAPGCLNGHRVSTGSEVAQSHWSITDIVPAITGVAAKENLCIGHIGCHRQHRRLKDKATRCLRIGRQPCRVNSGHSPGIVLTGGQVGVIAELSQC